MMRRIVFAVILFVTSPTSAATISRGTTWTDQQVLTHSALNSEFDILFNEVNGSLSAANLAADSVASSELLEGDDYTMQNLILSTTGPDIRWNPTSGDSFHAGAEYSATGGSIWFLSNVTDSQHYLRIRNDHLFEFPQYLSCLGGLTTGADGKVICNTTSIAGGINATRVYRTAGDVTTVSSSLADFTGATRTITTSANPVVVSWMASCSTSVGGEDVYFDVDIDGTLQLGTAGFFMDLTAAGPRYNCGFSFQTAALTAASHTIKLQWRNSSGGGVTNTVECNTSTPCIYSVMEVVD